MGEFPSAEGVDFLGDIVTPKIGMGIQFFIP